MKLLMTFLSILFLGPDIIDSGSIGEIKIGMTINDFLKISNAKEIVKKEKIQLEGDSYDIYNIYRNNKIVYAVEPNCEKECKVWRIWIYGKVFKTKEGIGVGNTLADLKKKYLIKELSTEGEGRVAIFVKEVNITFFLDSSKIPENWWSNQSVNTLSENLEITSIII